MKYVVLKVVNKGIERGIPIVFPDLLIHSEVAKQMQHMMLISHSMETEVVSAGFLSLFGTKPECSGNSESLGIKSRGEQDDQLITMYDYFHGVVM
jgi:hypothetical protein